MGQECKLEEGRTPRGARCRGRGDVNGKWWGELELRSWPQPPGSTSTWAVPNPARDRVLRRLQKGLNAPPPTLGQRHRNPGYPSPTGLASLGWGSPPPHLREPTLLLAPLNPSQTRRPRQRWPSGPQWLSRLGCLGTEMSPLCVDRKGDEGRGAHRGANLP